MGQDLEDTATLVLETSNSLCDWTDAHNELMGETLADVVKYVSEDLQVRHCTTVAQGPCGVGVADESVSVVLCSRVRTLCAARHQADD